MAQASKATARPAPLAAREIDALAQALERIESDLRTTIQSERERVAAEMASHQDGLEGDSADHADSRIRAGIEGKLMGRHLRDLAEVQAARRRLAAGTYGACADCGEPIGQARLAFNPAAHRCAACQTVRERIRPA